MLEIVKAKKSNSFDLAKLINIAGEGIPEYLWNDAKNGDESSMAVGAKRAEREEGGFSYKNAMICSLDNILVGMILAYRQEDPYEIGELSQYPNVVQPLVELESKAPGSWYINAIAVYEEYRGKGVARQLMYTTENQAVCSGCDSMSLIVASENLGAKGLYESLGFEVRDSRPVVSYPGCIHTGDWLLMTKGLKV